MSIDRQVLDAVLGLPAESAWPQILERLWQIMSPPITGSADSEIQRRDKAVESLDLLLAAAAWPLWESFEQHVLRTAQALQDFWGATSGGRAVLILDGTSLRELPWLTDGFWKFVERLTTGRRLVITADHGYAASAHVDDVADEAQRNYLRETFGAQRYVKTDDDAAAPWLPPLDLPLVSQHGHHRYVLGRRKWKVQGGTPTLTHGGLSLLEVAVPFIEL